MLKTCRSLQEGMWLPKPVSRIRRIVGIWDLGRTNLPEPPLKYARRYMRSLKGPQIHLGDVIVSQKCSNMTKTVKGPRPIWRYESSTRVFSILTSPAQKHLVIAELVSGGSLSTLLWPQGKVLGILPVRNWLCHMSTVDILVPEMRVPNEPPWSCALCPLGEEKLRERLQILTCSERAQHEHERSQLCHMFLWWSHENSAAAPTEVPTTHHPEVFWLLKHMKV